MTNSETSGVELPDMDLLKKFDVPAPRYTSYPTADRFNAEFTAEDYAALSGPRHSQRTGSAFTLCACAVLQRCVLLLRLQQDCDARP